VMTELRPALPRNGGSPQEADLPVPYERHRGHNPEQDREDSARDDYYQALRRHADGQASLEAVEDAYDTLRRVRR